MCSKSKTPKAATPAPAPAPPIETPVAPVINETATSERNLVSSNRKGRGSFRIDKTAAVVDGGAGLGIPTA